MQILKEITSLQQHCIFIQLDTLVGYDSIYQEILIAETTSSTTGEIFATNLSVNSPSIRWITLNYVTFEADLIANPSMTVEDAINASKIDEGYDNFTSQATSETKQVSWNNPTTMDEHLFIAMVYSQGAVIDPNS